MFIKLIKSLAWQNVSLNAKFHPTKQTPHTPIDTKLIKVWTLSLQSFVARCYGAVKTPDRLIFWIFPPQFDYLYPWFYTITKYLDFYTVGTIYFHLYERAIHGFAFWMDQ